MQKKIITLTAFIGLFVLTSCVQDLGYENVEDYTKAEPAYVIVKNGENLLQISSKYHVKAEDVARLNHIQPPYRVKVGQRLALPNYRIYIARRTDTLGKIAEKFDMDVAVIAKANKVNVKTQVKAGDIYRIPILREGSTRTADELNRELDYNTYDSAPLDDVSEVSAEPLDEALMVKPATREVYLEDIEEELDIDSLPAPMPRLKGKEPYDELLKAAEEGTPVPQLKEESKALLAKKDEPTKKAEKKEPVKKAEVKKPEGFAWPLDTVSNVTSLSDGLKIPSLEGTEIKASLAGKVVYVGDKVKGMGNLVMIQHNDGYITSYGHQSEVLVKKDDIVKKGQVLGKVGKSGGVEESQLYFSIRKGKTPQDATKLLPAKS